jgi:hypothetical protein
VERIYLIKHSVSIIFRLSQNLMDSQESPSCVECGVSHNALCLG